MKWFKHYSNVEFSEALSKVEMTFGFEGLGRYWRLLEFLNRDFDGINVIFKIERSKIRQLLRFRSWNDLESFANHLTIVSQSFADHSPIISGMELKRSGNVYEINAPILLELMGRDFKKTRQDRAETAPKNKIENKNKKEIKNNPLNPPPQKNDDPDFETIVSLWNEVCVSLPKIRLPLTKSRKEKLKSRLLQNPDTRLWREVLEKLEASDFCTGRNSDWKASFDWLIKNENNFNKTLEGNYDNKTRDDEISRNTHLWKDGVKKENDRLRIFNRTGGELQPQDVVDEGSHIPRLVGRS